MKSENRRPEYPGGSFITYLSLTQHRSVLLTVGVLIDDVVVVADQSEGSRLYTKGNYGYPRSGGGVDLDLMEATYLVECSRLSVEMDKAPMGFEELFRYSSGKVPGFEIVYTAYRDLRQRGLVVKLESGSFDLSVFPGGANMSNSRPEYYVRTVSERNSVEISEFVSQVTDVRKRNKKLLYGVVDEEGDIVYYTMSLRDPSGNVFPERMDRKPVGWLINDRVILTDHDDMESLRDYGYYGKMVGGLYQLSLIESCYLIGKGRLTVLGPDDLELGFEDLRDFARTLQDEFDLRYKVFDDMRQRGLVVKTGFKYGTHFRVYESSPDDCHARYLVHAVSDDGLKLWPEISRTVRLSGGVKKEILFGRVVRNEIQYLEFKWYKPGVIPKTGKKPVKK